MTKQPERLSISFTHKQTQMFSELPCLIYVRLDLQKAPRLGGNPGTLAWTMRRRSNRVRPPTESSLPKSLLNVYSDSLKAKSRCPRAVPKLRRGNLTRPLGAFQSTKESFNGRIILSAAWNAYHHLVAPSESLRHVCFNRSLHPVPSIHDLLVNLTVAFGG